MILLNKNQVTLLDVPKKDTGLYTDQLQQFVLVYNVLEMQGIGLLDAIASKILENCNGVLNVKEIASRIGVEEVYVCGVVENLWEQGIITLKRLKRVVPINRQHRKIDAWFHITNNCNLDCSYCYIHKSKDSMDWDIAKQSIDSLVRTAIRHDKSEVLIKFAGGEPLLKIDLIKKIVEYCRKVGLRNGIGFSFHIVTNGTLATKEIAGYMLDESIAVSVSLDGLSKYNDAQRAYRNGSGSFSEIDRGISILKDSGVTPYILTTVSSVNLPGLPKFTKYLLDRKLGFRYSLYRGYEEKADWIKPYVNAVIKYFSQCYDIIENNLPERSLLLMHQFCDVKLTRRKKRNCGVGSNGVVIGHRGEIAICQSILNKPVGDIWHGDMLDVVCKQHQYQATHYSVENIDGCKDCQWKYLCGGGCPLSTKSVFGTFNKQSPYCDAFKTLIPRLIRIVGLQIIKSQFIQKKGGEIHGD